MKLFTYGTLKKGHYNNYLLNGAEYLGSSKIKGYQCINSPGFPYAIKAKDDSSIIIGDVFEIERHHLSTTDRLEGYPIHYNRSEVETDYGTAWIYYITKDRYIDGLVRSYGFCDEWEDNQVCDLSQFYV